MTRGSLPTPSQISAILRQMGDGRAPPPLTFYTLPLLPQPTPCTSTHHGVYVEVIGMPIPSKFDLPQGTLDLLILRVVALGPVHGYAIAQRIQMISKDALQIQQGSLYPALHRLENKNFLVAEWGPTETGREAKFYRLTAKGRTQLKSETESWERLTEVVGMILQHSQEEAS